MFKDKSSEAKIKELTDRVHELERALRYKTGEREAFCTFTYGSFPLPVFGTLSAAEWHERLKGIEAKLGLEWQEGRKVEEPAHHVAVKKEKK